MEQEGMSLAETMRRGIDETKDQAGTAIDGLAAVARELEMEQTAQRLADIRARLDSDNFHLMVIGRFKNGKSTLLNALLGGTTHPVGTELGGADGPMVVNDLPATAILTSVHYAEQPYVTAWSFDGRREDWSFDRYQRESTLDSDPAVNAERFSDVQAFEMGFPAVLCQAGVTVFDSPGLDESPLRNAITRKASETCDAAIVVYRSDVLMGTNELMDADKLVKEGTRIFTVINMFHGRKPDDQIQSYVWNKYVREYLDDSEWAGQDLTAWGVHFVDAERARHVRYAGEAAEPDDSGLPILEEKLGEFLRHDRHKAHLKKHTTQAAEQADIIDQHAAQRLAGVQANHDELLAAYTRLLPSLVRLRERPAQLPTIFTFYRARAEAAVTLSANDLITRIRRELPAHIDGLELNLGPLTGIFKQKKAVAYVVESAERFINDSFAAWAEGEIQEQLKPIQAELSQKIDDEITAVGRAFDALHLELTGWQPGEGGKALVGRKERVAAAITGFALGGVGGAVAGGAGGLRSAAASAVGGVAAGFVLAVAGLATAPVAIPVVIAATVAAGAVGGAHNLAQRIKDKTTEETDEQLRDLPGTLLPTLIAQLRESYQVMEEVSTGEIKTLIAEEEHQIETLVEENQRAQGDGRQKEAWLADVGTRVTLYRKELRNALSKAGQV